MQPIRLIAMDMDGTLLTRIDPTTACIPAENAAVLRRCIDSEIHLVLASGRMPDDAAFFAEDAGLPMHIIGLNGSVILDKPHGRPMMAQYLPSDRARRVMEIMLEAGVDTTIFGLWDVVCMQDRPLSWAQRELGTYFGRADGRLAYHPCGKNAQKLLSQAGKIVALTERDREGLATARERIRREFPELSISSSWWNNFEVNPTGVDKGTALTVLAERLGVPMSQVMAIGDNDNDVPMLRAAGISVAMANANDAARAAATHVTLANDQFGVAAAIRALVFGEDVPGVQKK